jgi:hypothetical protein
MSEESTPPPLRLKARLRPDGDAPTPPETKTAQPESPPGDPAAVAAPKLRLKPRLDSGGATTEIPAPGPDPVPAPTEASAQPRPFQLKPRVAAPAQTPEVIAPLAPTDPGERPSLPATIIPSAPAESIDSPPAVIKKFELKPKAAVPPPVASQLGEVALPADLPAPPPPPKFPPPPGKNRTPPPFPVVSEPPVQPKKLPLPVPIPHLRAPSNVPESDLVASVNPTHTRGRSSKKILLGAAIAGALAIGALGYGWKKTRPAPPPAVAVPVAIPRPTPTSTPTIPPASADPSKSVAAIPKKLIDDAQNTLAGRRTLEQNRIDALAAGEEPSDKRAIATPPPSTFAPTSTAAKTTAPAPVTSTSQLSPGVTVTTTATDVVGDASPAFRAWVAQLKLNGVFHGSPPRALINGRTYRAGQVVDDALGITFETIDTDAKTIVFRDRSGATASRRY